MTDFTIQNHGSLFLCIPNNDEAREHLEENVGDGALWYGGALAVEPRYARDLADSLTANGWEVE